MGFEIDLNLLGCNSKIIWNEIFNIFMDIVATKPHNTGIILCKNFHNIHNDFGDALISISKAHAEGGLAKPKSLASSVIHSAYGYQFGSVAFNPTWTKGSTTFRDTSAGNLSYFVGADPVFMDSGFAIGTHSSKRS